MSNSKPIDRKLGTLADIIGLRDFTDSAPLSLDSTSVHDHLKQAHEQACGELRSAARIISTQSQENSELAERIMTAYTTLKLVADMYFERRETENERRVKPRSE